MTRIESTSASEPSRGLIAWFVNNPIAANFLMIVIVAGGLLTAGSIRQQLIPTEALNTATVSIAYPGASASEIEQSIAVPIENALSSMEGVDDLVTYSNRNEFTAELRLDETQNIESLLDRIQTAIDGTTLPGGAGKSNLTLDVDGQPVMYVNLYGDLEQDQLAALGNEIHKDLQSMPAAGVVSYLDEPVYEFGIEIDQNKLREHGLRFDSIAESIREYSGNLSAGHIQRQSDVLSMRVENQAYSVEQLANTPVRSLSDGTRIKLGDIAHIRKSATNGSQFSNFNQKNSVSFYIEARESQSISDVAAVINQYISEKSQTLPDGVQLEPWIDFTYYLEGRLRLMLDNIKWSLALVFIVLCLFLQLRLAFWVTMGLPISFLGALIFMPASWIDVTINISSLFGFILVLGIVVDDAIVIGESINSRNKKSGHSLNSVLRGVKSVSLPVTVGVVTTMIAFVPLLATNGESAEMSKAISVVVILCLIFSMIESKLILPAHLHQFGRPGKTAISIWLSKIREHIDGRFSSLVQTMLVPFLRVLLSFRYVVVAFFVSMLLLTASLFDVGIIKFIGSPKIPNDYPVVQIDMVSGTSIADGKEIVEEVASVLHAVDAQVIETHGAGMIDKVFISSSSPQSTEITIKLVEPSLRPIDPFLLSELWRSSMPDLLGLQSLIIEDSLFSSSEGETGGSDFGVVLESLNAGDLDSAVNELAWNLQVTKGVGNVSDSRDHPEQEIKITLKELAYNLGLNHALVASQIHSSFFGLEAQRVITDQGEIPIVLRLPQKDRQSLAQIENTMIYTADGTPVPFSQVADIEFVNSMTMIRRANGRKSIAVDADINPAVGVTPETLYDDILPAVLAQYPSVSVENTGRLVREDQNTRRVLMLSLLCFILIYSLIAIVLKSYLQPLIVLTAIPFCIIGAIIGHVVLGMSLSSYSLFGVVAAAGVCVNDSLILVDRINKSLRSGKFRSIKETIADSIQRRFRAVVLTSVTTFVGLAPIIMESGLQAKLIVPMAVSLAFGVLFATVVTLMLVPCQYYIWNDLQNAMRIKNVIQEPAS